MSYDEDSDDFNPIAVSCELSEGSDILPLNSDAAPPAEVLPIPNSPLINSNSSLAALSEQVNALNVPTLDEISPVIHSPISGDDDSSTKSEEVTVIPQTFNFGSIPTFAATNSLAHYVIDATPLKLPDSGLDSSKFLSFP